MLEFIGFIFAFVAFIFNLKKEFNLKVSSFLLLIATLVSIIIPSDLGDFLEIILIGLALGTGLPKGVIQQALVKNRMPDTIASKLERKVRLLIFSYFVGASLLLDVFIKFFIIAIYHTISIECLLNNLKQLTMILIVFAIAFLIFKGFVRINREDLETIGDESLKDMAVYDYYTRVLALGIGTFQVLSVAIIASIALIIMMRKREMIDDFIYKTLIRLRIKTNERLLVMYTLSYLIIAGLFTSMLITYQEMSVGEISISLSLLTTFIMLIGTAMLYISYKLVSMPPDAEIIAKKYLKYYVVMSLLAILLLIALLSEIRYIFTTTEFYFIRNINNGIFDALIIGCIWGFLVHPLIIYLKGSTGSKYSMILMVATFGIALIYAYFAYGLWYFLGIVVGMLGYVGLAIQDYEIISKREVQIKVLQSLF